METKTNRGPKGPRGIPHSPPKWSSDISDILGGIKTKKVNIKNPNQEEGSTVSLSELKEMNNSMKSSAPKSQRKKKSDKNILDTRKYQSS